MRATAGMLLLCVAISCGYGPAVGPPPGPVPGPSGDDDGPPRPAGELAPVEGNGSQRVIAAGIYRGDLTIEGNGNLVQGAGIDRTIVRGDLRIRGDANVVHSLRVLGGRAIEGEENDVRGTAFGEQEAEEPPAEAAEPFPSASAGG